jgi:uncharacterized protein (TIGR00251 family)
MSGWWSATEDGILVSVRVTPGSKRSDIAGATADRLRVRVAAPAVEGKANAELTRFLAERFGVRASAVTIVRGEHGREKTILIAGIDAPPSDMQYVD